MTEYSRAQHAQPTSVRILDTARAIECIALVAGAGLAITTLPFPSAFIAIALLGMAAVLAPRDRVSVDVARATKRREAVRRLTAEGLVLRWRYTEVRKLPLGQARSDALWSVRRDIMIWLETGLDRLAGFPEIEGILRSHRATGGLIDELDSVLQRLGEIRRLIIVSEKQKLPF